MSLLEDVFLEDEAGEAQELERVIEGDELDERPRTPDSNEDSEKEDEAEEDKRVVDHTAKAKRVVKNPRFVLNPARLTGPRGIQIIPEHFKDFKFKGKGHEREDLDCVLKKLEHWAYRLYPKFKFDDCLKKIETLGKKRPVMVHLHKIRTDQFLSEETVQQQDSSGDEAAPAPQEEDEFDRLLQQQIELARSTPAPSSTKKEIHTPASNDRSSLMAPRASSSPSISDEQKERMIRNRKLAEERRLARLNETNNTAAHNNTSYAEPIPEREEEVNDERVNVHNTIVINDDVDKDVPIVRKHNRNVIDSDSSDNENDILAVNESVIVDVHPTMQKDVENKENNSDKENTALEAAELSVNAIDINKSSRNNKESAMEYDLKETDSDKTQENLTTHQTSEDISDSEITRTVLDKTENNLTNHKTSEDTSNSEITGIVSDNDIDNNVKENTVLSSIADQNEEIDSKKDSSSVTEELMDVDFTDNF